MARPLICAILTLMTLQLMFAGCQQPSQPPYTITEEPAPRGERILGIDVNMGEEQDFDAAMSAARSAGLDAVSFSLNWDQIEREPGVYQDPGELLAIANAYYPAHGARIELAIRAVDTDGRHLPEDLRKRALDDPEVIERYNRMMDFVLAKLADAQLVSIAVGNEIDLGLGTDDQAYEQYARFVRETKAHLHTARPGVPVGATATMDGLTTRFREPMRRVNEQSDVIMVTYYPLHTNFSVKRPDIVHTDMMMLAQLYPQRSIYFTEIGYPTSEALQSSEERQQEFIREAFEAWDDNQAQVKYLSFTWLHDVPGEQAEQFVEYYGFDTPGFREYVRTLGVRTEDGEPKLAYAALKAEAAARGWTQSG